mgnify:CR=1 FL=1
MRYLTSTNRKGYARMLFHRFSEKEWNFLKNDENNECFSCLMFYSRTGNAGRLEEEITDMKVDILSREYPPKVYGGAGVHVEELSKVLAERVDVTVRAFDGPRTAADIPAIPGTDPKGSLTVVGYDVPKELEDANGALKTFGVDLQIANDVDADIIHAHTWYACLAGYLAKMLHDTPLVITAHSLEPFRPWKREQLGGGYNLSSWAEKDAYEHADRVIAVSAGMREDILTAYPNLDPDKVVVVHNGITMSQFETPADDDPGWKVFERYNIDRSKPTLLFVGRITRQKGLPYLLQALHFVDPNIQVVLCAGAPDTPEIMEEVKTAFAKLDEERGNIICRSRSSTHSNMAATHSSAHPSTSRSAS